MKILIIILSILFLSFVVLSLYFLKKVKRLRTELRRTRDWGEGMRKEAIKYSDLYHNLKNTKEYDRNLAQ